LVVVDEAFLAVVVSFFPEAVDAFFSVGFFTTVGFLVAAAAGFFARAFFSVVSALVGAGRVFYGNRAYLVTFFFPRETRTAYLLGSTRLGSELDLARGTFWLGEDAFVDTRADGVLELVSGGTRDVNAICLGDKLEC
jgi:hypothetical protein